MSAPVVTRIVIVRHEQGLHARPAELVARTAMQFASKVEIIRDGNRIDAKSILNILTLGAAQGTELSLEAEGDDARAAIEALAQVVEGEFSEDAPQGASDESTAQERAG